MQLLHLNDSSNYIMEDTDPRWAYFFFWSIKNGFFCLSFCPFLKVTHNKYEEGYLVRRLELENVYWVEILGNC